MKVIGSTYFLVKVKVVFSSNLTKFGSLDNFILYFRM